MTVVVVGVFRDPLPLSVVHIPLCVTFAFFDGGKFMLVDPTQREQMVADGTVVVAMNKHREICMLETSGCVLLTLEQVRYSAVFVVLCPVEFSDILCFLVHDQVTIIFVVSVCLYVCAEFFSAVFDPISIKLGHVLYV